MQNNVSCLTPLSKINHRDCRYECQWSEKVIGKEGECLHDLKVSRCFQSGTSALTIQEKKMINWIIKIKDFCSSIDTINRE